MKILVISQYYYPEPFRVTDICESLAEKGHEVSVLTGLPNYPSGEIFFGYEDKEKRLERINNVKIIRCVIRPRKTGTVNLLLNYLSYMISASFIVNRIHEKFDLIYVYQLSPVLMTVPAIIKKKKSGIPILLYCCDIWPESIRDVFKSDKGIPYRITRSFSSYIYQQCDIVAVSSEQFIDYLNDVCGVKKEKMLYIPQHAEDIYQNIEIHPQNNDVYKFVFLGNIGLSQQCETIIEAVGEIKTGKTFEVHFVGDGSREKEVRQLVCEKRLEDKVFFHGRHPVADMPKYLEFADVCLLTLADDSVIGQTIPAKLQSYMAAGKMVLASAGKAISDLINISECGKCVPSGDYFQLAAEMECCINGKYNSEKFGLMGKEYYQRNFSKTVILNKFEKQMELLVNREDETENKNENLTC